MAETYDLPTVQKWMVVGSALRRLILGRGKAAQMYSYNGVVLPKLPEWDKTAYPYAVIYQEIGSYLGELRETNALYCFAEPLQWNYLLGYVTDNPGIRLRSQYIPTSGDTTWGEFTEEEYGEISGLGQAWASGSLVWAWSNHDITNYSDGTVYIAGVEPIPIYE